MTDSLSVPCNSKRISFRVHVRKDPTIFLADFPTEICPRDVLNTELCIFYEWYNHVPEAHWEFTQDRVDFVDGTSSDSRSRRFIFRNRENIPIRSLCRRWGVRKRMSMEVF